MSALNNNSAIFLISGGFHVLLFSKGQHSRSIIVHDGDSTAGIFAIELLTGCNVVKFNKEVFIWFPILVIDNFDLNFCLFFAKSAAFEINDLIYCNIILWRCRFSIYSSYSYTKFIAAFVLDFHSKHTSTFTNRVMEAWEANIWVSHVLFKFLSLFVFSANNGTLFDGIFGISDRNLFTIFESLKKRCSVSEFFFKLIFVNK